MSDFHQTDEIGHKCGTPKALWWFITPITCDWTDSQSCFLSELLHCVYSMCTEYGVQSLRHTQKCSSTCTCCMFRVCVCTDHWEFSTTTSRGGAQHVIPCCLFLPPHLHPNIPVQAPTCRYRELTRCESLGGLSGGTKLCLWTYNPCRRRPIVHWFSISISWVWSGTSGHRRAEINFLSSGTQLLMRDR